MAYRYFVLFINFLMVLGCAPMQHNIPAQPSVERRDVMGLNTTLTVDLSHHVEPELNGLQFFASATDRVSVASLRTDAQTDQYCESIVFSNDMGESIELLNQSRYSIAVSMTEELVDWLERSSIRSFNRCGRTWVTTEGFQMGARIFIRDWKAEVSRRQVEMFRPVVAENYDEFTRVKTYSVNMSEEINPPGMFSARFMVVQDRIHGSIQAAKPRGRYDRPSVCDNLILLIDGTPLSLNVESREIDLASAPIDYELLVKMSEAKIVRARVCSTHEIELSKLAMDKLGKLKLSWDKYIKQD